MKRGTDGGPLLSTHRARIPPMSLFQMRTVASGREYFSPVVAISDPSLRRSPSCGKSIPVLIISSKRLDTNRLRQWPPVSQLPAWSLLLSWKTDGVVPFDGNERTAGPPTMPRIPTARMHMLVLSRRVNESLVIDGIVHIVVTEVNGRFVKLGITAPREIPVLRSELAVRPVIGRTANLPAATRLGGENRSVDEGV